MFDKNVVVRALDCCSARPMDCDICPYEGYVDPDGDDYPNCKEKMMIDAMVLLKEQEAVEPRVSSAEQRCGNCNKIIEMDGWKACPWCGKPINWESWW